MEGEGEREGEWEREGERKREGEKERQRVRAALAGGTCMGRIDPPAWSLSRCAVR